MNEGNRELVKDSMKDLLISIIIVAVIFLSLYAYTQNWPPIVIVESGSMQHGESSHIGIIDTGDIVLVKKIYSEEDVVTYVEGRMSGYERYGDYGDVIIYNYQGKSIIHRAIVYLKWSGSHWELRGWNSKDFGIYVKLKSYEIENGGVAANITLEITKCGKKLDIQASKLSVLGVGVPQDVLNSISISSSENKIKEGTFIYLNGVKIRYLPQIQLSFYDSYTQAKRSVPLLALQQNEIKLTFSPSWLHVSPQSIVIDDAGYAHKDIVIDLNNLNHNVVGDAGFITMGDNNLAIYGSKAYDQNSENFIPICPKLVSYNMIKGVARGEIPWFGAIKLYVTHTNTNEIPANTKTYLILSILGIFALTFIGDYISAHRKEIWSKIKSWRRRSEE